MDNLWIIYVILVGGLNPSEKYNMKVSWDDIWENKNCSKAPTSLGLSANDTL